MNKLNVGIIGCGAVADGHIKAWRKIRQASIIAVCDLNESLAKNTAEVWKVPHYYKSFSNLLDDNNINIVDICTPPQTHANLSIHSMQTGCNVLIEKPMTMTIEDAKKIVECKNATGIKAGVLHNWLFDAPIIDTIILMEKDYLGEIINMEVEILNTRYDYMFSNKNHWCHNYPGGRFSEMLAHPIYLIRHFLGGEEEVRDIQVLKLSDYPWIKSDELCATLKVGNKLGRIYASFNSPREAIYINLYGEKAIIKLDIINSTINIFPKRKNTRFNKGYDVFRQAAQLSKSIFKNGFKIISRRWLSGHEMFIKLFSQSLIENSEPPVTVEEGLAVIDTLQTMCKKIDIIEKHL